MVVVRGERADAFDEKLCVVCVVFEGKRGVCGVSLRRVSIETRLSFHINQSSNRFPGRTFQNDDDDDNDENDGERRRRVLFERDDDDGDLKQQKTHLIYRAHFLSSSVKETTTVRESAFFEVFFVSLLRLSIFLWRHLWTHFFPILFTTSSYLFVSSTRDDETKDDGDDDDAFPAFADDDDENDDFDDSSRETDDKREDTKTEETSVRRRSICQRREGKTAQRGADEKTVRRVSRRGESAVLQLHDETHRVGRRTGRISRG